MLLNLINYTYIHTIIEFCSALKKKNDQLEAEIEKSKKSKKAADDFTLIGTSKSGSVQAGLNAVRKSIRNISFKYYTEGYLWW